MSDDTTERRPVGPAGSSGGWDDENARAWGNQAIAEAAEDELRPGGRLWRLLNGGD